MITVFPVGKARITSSSGHYDGIPALMVEPVVDDHLHKVGDTNPNAATDSLLDGSVVFQIFEKKGVEVLIEDLKRAAALLPDEGI